MKRSQFSHLSTSECLELYKKESNQELGEYIAFALRQHCKGKWHKGEWKKSSSLPGSTCVEYSSRCHSVDIILYNTRVLSYNLLTSDTTVRYGEGYGGYFTMTTKDRINWGMDHMAEFFHGHRLYAYACNTWGVAPNLTRVKWQDSYTLKFNMKELLEKHPVANMHRSLYENSNSLMLGMALANTKCPKSVINFLTRNTNYHSMKYHVLNNGGDIFPMESGGYCLVTKVGGNEVQVVTDGRLTLRVELS